MTALVQYVRILRSGQASVARKMGVDLSRADKGTRVLMESNLVMIATVVKALVDHGVITDDALLQTVAALRSAVYADEPVVPPTWPDTAVAPAGTAGAHGQAYDAVADGGPAP